MKMFVKGQEVWVEGSSRVYQGVVVHQHDLTRCWRLEIIDDDFQKAPVPSGHARAQMPSCHDRYIHLSKEEALRSLFTRKIGAA